MSYLKKVILIFLTLSTASCSYMTPSIDNDILVKLERTACLGECPVYTVVVKKNGEVTYDGREYVFVIGSKTSIIPKDSVASIESELMRAKFLTMKSKLHPASWGCFISATDHSYIIIEGVVKNKIKAVSTYTGCDAEQVHTVTELESYIEKVTGISKWLEENSIQNQ